jgi:hypothetical protein
MMKLGARRGVAEFKNVFQSVLLRGANSFVPSGHEFFSSDRLISKQFTHFTTGPGE